MKAGFIVMLNLILYRHWLRKVTPKIKFWIPKSRPIFHQSNPDILTLSQSVKIRLCNFQSQEDARTKLFEHLGKQNASKLIKHEHRHGRIGPIVISLVTKTMNLSLVKEREPDIASRFKITVWRDLNFRYLGNKQSKRFQTFAMSYIKHLWIWLHLLRKL